MSAVTLRIHYATRYGERLFLDCMLHHDYSPGDGAMAVSVYPLVEASGVTDASIEGVCLDGNKDEETFELNGCRGGGVYIYQSRGVAVRGVVTERPRPVRRRVPRPGRGR